MLRESPPCIKSIPRQQALYTFVDVDVASRILTQAFRKYVMTARVVDGRTKFYFEKLRL